VSRLPFDNVSPVFEYDPPDGHYEFERCDTDGESRMWKPGDLYLTRKRGDGKTELVNVPAIHVICFHANIKGSETATFGLATHPPVVIHREDVITYPEDCGESRHINAGATIEFPTRLKGWYSWSACTKTQYAANPRDGGPANFLRAHLSIFKAVDEAEKLGLKTFIRDDGHYWRHRDESKLLKELAKYDELIAGFAGRLSDALDSPGAVVAPIKDRPDFEHLEAKGADRIDKRPPPRKKRKKRSA
jgi:hypothetical protein